MGTQRPPLLSFIFWYVPSGIVLIIALFGALLIINFLQMASAVVWPFSQQLFRKINRELANQWWSWAELAMTRGRSVNIILTGDTIPVRENAIVMCNHQEMTDIAVLFFLAKQSKRLGDMKWFAKDVIKYVPRVGWGMLFLDCIYVKRDWYSDKNKILATFQKFYEKNIPIWLMIFPEGTRIRPHKLAKANSIAKDKGMDTFKNVLLPRTKGMVASVQGLRQHIQAIYDVTIIYNGPAPSLLQLFMGFTKSVNIHASRIPIESLPQEQEEIANWVINCFRKKDLKMETAIAP